MYDVYDSVTLLAARSQAPAWERDCNKSFALNQKNEIEPEKEARTPVQARSQAGAWERENERNERIIMPAYPSVCPVKNCPTVSSRRGTGGVFLTLREWNRGRNPHFSALFAPLR